MARIRSIHPGLATDETYMSMTMAAKAAWPLLWTECDDNGIFEWKPIVLKARLLPYDNVDFSDLLAEYVRLGCVIKAEIDGRSYGAVRNFCRYQRPKKPNSVHPINDDFRNFVRLTDAISEQVPNQFPTGGENSPQMEDGGCKGNNNIGSDEPPSRAKRSKAKDGACKDDLVQEFESTFWPAYPRRVGKANALKAFKAARKGISLDAIMASLRSYAEARHGKDPEYTKHPSSWLNSKPWADDGIDGVATSANPAFGPGPRGWESVLFVARNNEDWDSKIWGPKPGLPGCLVPAELLKPTDGVGWREWNYRG